MLIFKGREALNSLKIGAVACGYFIGKSVNCHIRLGDSTTNCRTANIATAGGLSNTYVG